MERAEDLIWRAAAAAAARTPRGETSKTKHINRKSTETTRANTLNVGRSVGRRGRDVVCYSRERVTGRRPSESGRPIKNVYDVREKSPSRLVPPLPLPVRYVSWSRRRARNGTRGGTPRRLPHGRFIRFLFFGKRERTNRSTRKQRDLYAVRVAVYTVSSATVLIIRFLVCASHVEQVQAWTGRVKCR